ncbi:MAG TPA: hypothetical protein PLD88_14575, partial [Candidatus Berkiella sp.]|nr:hypothetical protein [Candidatus Berkiella sp.]
MLQGFLEQLKKMEGSDLYLTTGAFPSVKVNGKLQPISNVPLKKGEIKALAYEIMEKEKIAEFEKSGDKALLSMGY